MRQLITILLAICCSFSGRADTWADAEPIAAASSTGAFVVRVVPGDGKSGRKPRATLFELRESDARYVKVRAFDLVNRYSPVSVSVSDTGEIYTLDDWGMMGADRAVVWYSKAGKVQKIFSLADLFPAAELETLQKKHRSVSSVHWRRGAPWFNGPYLVIDESLGGYVAIGEGEVHYTPAESRSL